MYFLVSGRWFTAPGFNGPWTFATPTLPEDFKKIPLSHQRSRVLASVPGTDEAAEAVLLAQIPQTARVDKKQVKAPEVQYQGEPQFQPIEQTTVSRAVNTDKDIIKVGDLYYMCFQGVWFMGRSPNGPWEVTGSVPGQIYEIPVSSPSYNVTNVTVVEDNSDAVVFATAAAYTGLMIGWGCAVWGTGYYYPPYVGYGGFYPVLPPATTRPTATTPRTTRGPARTAAASSAYGPYGGAGVGARYNPRTGTYARGAAAYGPYGARGVAGGLQPAHRRVRRDATGLERLRQLGTDRRAARRSVGHARRASPTTRTGTTTRVTQGSGGGAAVTRTGPQGSGGVARTGSGDVYAGRDGNVYKKQGGSWQKYDRQRRLEQRPATDAAAARSGAAAGDRRTRPGRHARVDATRSTVGQLNRDSAARAEGAQRTRDAGSTSARSGSSSSYRPSSGGATRRAQGRRRPATVGGAADLSAWSDRHGSNKTL